MNPRKSIWYKEAVMYELHVRCFYDSNGDGVGDFRGLTEKLDYLQELGVTAIWLLPFYPSPLKDDGYDISDYYSIHPHYGSLNDFRHFLKEAHLRGLKVITELVINHTSDQHPWFQRARRSAKGSKERDYYVWSDTPERYKDARVIFQDFEVANWTWDPVAQSYYWHRFYSHQPDLNFANPAVKKEIMQILHFWLGMGVDGVRLDAIPYLFEREGTTCENLPETHAFLKELRLYVDKHFPDRMLLAEANQWPEEAVAYFGEGDECHMAFHFPLMPRLFMGIHLEDSLPILDIMKQTPEIPFICQWALFLRNHDELTLEMVTDEERDYMFRVYAHDPQARLNLGIRRRLAPLLNNDRRKIELINTLLFSLGGTPVLYYGDEIGMGDNIYLGDRNGVRTPMQWSSDKNAGFSQAHPQRLYLPPLIDPEYHYEILNVEAQRNRPYSLYWWTKQLIALRKRFKEFAYGKTVFLRPQNRKVLAFIRQLEGKALLVVANLSRFSQYVELDLSAFEGSTPIELFSNGKFPPIGELPYLLTLGPYSYHWFFLEKEEAGAVASEKKAPPLHWTQGRNQLFSAKGRKALEAYIGVYLLRQPFHELSLEQMDRTKSALLDVFSFSFANRLHLILYRIVLLSGEAFITPIWCEIEEGEKTLKQAPERVIVFGKEPEDENHVWVLKEIQQDKKLCDFLQGFFSQSRHLKGRRGELKVEKEKEKMPVEKALPKMVEKVDVLKEGERTFFIIGDHAYVLREKIPEGVDVDIEMRRMLMRSSSFESFLPLQTSLFYQPVGGDDSAIAFVEYYVPHAFSGAEQAITEVENFLLNQQGTIKKNQIKTPSILAYKDLLSHKKNLLLNSHNLALNKIGELLGELQRQLAHLSFDADFRPLSFTPFYQRSLFHALRRKAEEAFDRLQTDLICSKVPKEVLEKGKEAYSFVTAFLQRLPQLKIHALRIRYVGNFNLASLLNMGKEFYIRDFCGNARLPFSERRFKRSCFVDVCDLIASLFETSFKALGQLKERGMIEEKNYKEFVEQTSLWAFHQASIFLKSYLEKVKNQDFFPLEPITQAYLFDLSLLESGLELILSADEPAKLEAGLQFLHLWGLGQKGEEKK